MITDKSISFFAPAFNEEANIRQFVKEAYSFLEKNFKEFEIIIVNDGSTDKTEEILRSLRLTYKNLTFVTHPINKGYGEALKSGFKTSKNDLIFFTDSDLQFDLKDLLCFIDEVKMHPVVIGYRNKRSDNLSRKINAKMWGILIKIVLGLKVRDIDCAFKIFRKESLEGISLKSSGALISAELLAKLKGKGLTFKEVPVSHYPREKGKQTGARPKVIIKAFQELISLRYNIKSNEKGKQSL